MDSQENNIAALESEQPAPITVSNDEKCSPTLPFYKRHNKYYALIADIIIIAVLTLLALECNLIWNINNAHDPAADYAHHFVETSAFSYVMHSSHSLGAAIITAWTWPGSYPPGQYLTTFLFSSWFGEGIKASLFSQLLLLPMLITGLYYLLRRDDGPVAATATVLIAACLPNFILCSDSYLLDFPSAAATCLCLSLLLASDRFSKPLPTISFGIVLGYGCLLKYTTLVFIIPALLVIIYFDKKLYWQNWKACLAHLLIIVSAVSLPVIWAAQSESLQTTMLNERTYMPSQAVVIVGICLGAALLWWILTTFSLGADQEARKKFTNLSRALCLAYLAITPWVVSNLDIIVKRSSPLKGEMMGNILYDYPNVLSNLFSQYSGALNFQLAIIGIVLAFTTFGAFRDKVIAFTTVTSTLCTEILLGAATRYICPAYALSSALIVSTFRNIKGGFWIALILGLCNCYSSVWLAICPNNDVYHLHFIPRDSETKAWPDANSSPFGQGWKTASLVQTVDPKIAPLLVAVNYDEGLQMNPSDSFKTGMQVWTNWHNLRIIPVLFHVSSDRIREQLTASLPREIVGLDRDYPLLSETVKDLAFHNTTRVFDVVIDIHSPGLVPITDLQVNELLNPDKAAPATVLSKTLPIKRIISVCNDKGQEISTIDERIIHAEDFEIFIYQRSQVKKAQLRNSAK